MAKEVKDDDDCDAMMQSWRWLFDEDDDDGGDDDDDDDWVLRMKGAGTAWPVITASSAANTSHCTEHLWQHLILCYLC